MVMRQSKAWMDLKGSEFTREFQANGQILSKNPTFFIFMNSEHFCKGFG